MHRILIVMLCIVVSALGRTAVAQDPAREASAPAVSARQLDAADVEGIKRALDGKTAAEINALLPTLVPGDVPIKNSLGQASTDLVYVPVAPCRIIDTRVAGGKYAANEARAYHIVGSTDYSAFGGNASGCGIPGDLVSNPIDVSGLFILSEAQKVRALALNIVAVNPNGAGDLRIWPNNQTLPTASVLNYAAYSGLNIANGIIMTSCDAFDFLFPIDPCPNGDISVLADVSGTHLVVDVTGYFMPATGYGRRGSNSKDTNVTLSGTCQNVLSVGINNNSNYARTVVCTASVNIDVTHTTGTMSIVDFEIADAATTCDAIGDSGMSIFNVQSSSPSSFYYNTAGLLKTFELAANTSATYYLNGYQYSGAGTSYAVGESMTCFIP